jgi:hypothetical protein
MVAPEHHQKVDVAVVHQGQDSPLNTFTTPFFFDDLFMSAFSWRSSAPGIP